MTARNCCLLFAAWMLLLDIPQLQAEAVLRYQGRVYASGSPFSGEGLFAFAVLDSAGAILWASGEFPYEGIGKPPPAGALKLPVRNGAYEVKLGEAARGMPRLDVALLRRAPAPKLRVWFSDGSHGWFRAGEEVPLSPLLASGGEAAPGGLTGSQTDAILQELKELRARLERQGNPPQAQPPPEPTTATIPVGPGPSLGRRDAPLVMIEFTDYQCPFCKRFDDTVMADLTKNFVETGKLRILSRNLPLAFHNNAEPAAMAALCADQQKQYWAMRGKLFANATTLTPSNFLRAAEELKLDMAAFRSCMDEKRFAAQIKSEGDHAAAAGITGTPSFVIGREADGKVTGAVVVGAQPYAAFESQIKKLLAGGRAGGSN